MILKSKESQWETMGRLARKAWQQHYSPDQLGIEIVRLAQLVLEKQSHSIRKQRIYARYYQIGPRQTSLIQTRLRKKARRILKQS